MRLAYMTVTFPCLRETFVLREIEYLKNHPEFKSLKIYGYQPPGEDEINADNEKWLAEARYFKRRYLYNLLILLRMIMTRPIRVGRMLKMWVREIPSLDIRTNYKIVAHILTAFGVARQAEIDGIKHIHTHFATASTITLMVHILTGIPFSFTAHASGDIYVYSPFLMEKMRAAKKIIAISEYNRRYLHLISGYTLDPQRVVVINNGVKVPEAFVERLPDDVPMLFTSAAFAQFKGYGTLLEALKILKEKGLTFCLRAAGGGPLFERMQAQVIEYGLVEEVKLLGPQPYSLVQEYLLEADIFVFAAEIGLNGARDGMPTAITEAIASGLPVVATHITGIPEQVQDGASGFLVEERAPAAFADRLAVLIEDARLRNDMGRKGHAIAKRKFDMNINLKQLETVFNS